MAGDGDFGLAVTTPGFNSLIKPADVTIVTALGIEQRAVGRLDKGPFQIHIDVASYRAKANLPPVELSRDTNPL